MKVTFPCPYLYEVSLDVFQDERYKKYIGKMAVVPLSGGREVPIIADEVCVDCDFYAFSGVTFF